MKKIIIILSALLNSGIALAQVGINTTTPDLSANLDVSPVDKDNNPKGTLLSAMTTAQRTTIASPANGLVVYDTNLKCLMSNNGTTSVPVWECIGGSNATTGLAYFKEFHYALPATIPYNAGNYNGRTGTINNSTAQNILSNWLRTNDPSQVAELPIVDGIRVDIVFVDQNTYRPLIINANATSHNVFGLTKADIDGTYKWPMPSVLGGNGGYLNIDNDLLLGWAYYNTETSKSEFRILGDSGSLYRVTFWGYVDSTGKKNIHFLLEKFAPQTGGVHN